MKNPTKYLSLFILSVLFACSTGWSQTFAEDDDSDNNTDEELVRDNVVTPRIFRSLGINNAPNPRNQQIQGNTVFLTQIGELNRAAIITDTEASEINLTQNGDENFTALVYRAKTAVSDLVQNGDSNRIIDFVYSPGADISLDLTQDGDNLYFERFGTNRLTESLKFRQTQAAPTVIIRSFQ